MVTHNRGDGVTGGLCLRHTVSQLHALLAQLEQYRPSVGESVARWLFGVLFSIRSCYVYVIMSMFML